MLRLIKLGLLSIIFLFIILTGVCLFIPSHIRVSKAINIQGSRDSIWALVGETTRWQEWHPAFMQNHSTSLAPIHIITSSRTDSSIVMELKQGNKRPVVNGWNIFQRAGADSLTLQWYMDFHQGWYPWEKLGSLFYENTYGVLMEQGLGNIKKRTEP